MVINLYSASDVEIVQSAIRAHREVNPEFLVGLTSGCFDLVHFQHQNYLARCRHRVDFLIVGVDADHLVREVKGASRPIIPDYQRTIMVASLEAVQVAFTLGKVVDLVEAVKLFDVDYIIRNQEFEGRESEIYGAELAHKGAMLIPDVVALDSTSNIIRQVVSLERETA